MSEEDPALDSSAKLEEFSVVHSSGEVRTEFTVGLLPAALTEGPQIQVILIGKLEGKVLVGFPFSAWHRLRDRRSLQNFNFAKPTAVEVLVVREDNMEDVVEGKLMKIWIGFVNQEVLDSMMFGEDASQAEHNFGRGGLEGCLPSARSLADVAEQHFSFLSAMSEPARADERREGESGLEGLFSRMSQLEASVGTIASSLKELLSHQKPSGTSSHSQGRQTSFVAPTPKQAASSMTNLYPSLDQGAVNAALQSGVPREALGQSRSFGSKEVARSLYGEASSSGDGFGGGRATGRRVWVSSRALRPDFSFSSQADFNCGKPCRVQEGEEWFKIGSGSRKWAWDFSRWCRNRWRKTAGCCLESSSNCFERQPDGDLQPPRTVDGRGPHVRDFDPGAASSDVFSQSLGGTQEQDRELPHVSSLSMVDSGCSGLLSEGGCSGMSSSALPFVVATGPDGLRPGLLELEFRPIPRTGTTSDYYELACASRPTARRPPVLKVVGSEVGRDFSCSHPRHRHLLDQKKDSRKAERSKGQGEDGVRSKEKSQGKAQSKKPGGACFRRVMPDAATATGTVEAEGSDVHHKVPGSEATTVRVNSILNSLPRWVLQTQCTFSGFLRSLLHGRELREEDSTQISRAFPWPMPLPYPEAFRKSSGTSKKVSLGQKRLVCLQIALLDWFALGKPEKAPWFICLGRRLSSSQWSIVSTLMHLSFDGNSPEEVDAVLMGRSAAKVEALEEEINSIHQTAAILLGEKQSYFGIRPTRPEPHEEAKIVYKSGAVIGHAKALNLCGAKELVPERLKFPQAPAFDPVPFMDNLTAKVYEDPVSMGSTPARVAVELIPKVQVRASRKNLVALYKKLRDCGRLEPVTVCPSRAGFLSGLFAVGKDAEKDRLILDSRPPNLLEKQLDKWVGTMANASILGDLHLADDQVVLCSGTDLRDFFYQFRASKTRTARNALVAPLHRHEAVQVFGSENVVGSGPFFCGLSSLAMGDTNAVEFAQCSHVSLCHRFKVLSEEELLTLRLPLPRSLVCGGIIVDDLVVLEKLTWKVWEDVKRGMASQADERVDRALEGY